MVSKRVAILIIIFLWFTIPLNGWAEELAVIVNVKNPVGMLGPAEIRKYFLKEHLAWDNGEKVRSVDRNGMTSERRIFLEKVIKLNDVELEQFWVSKRYEKGVPIPPKLGSDREVMEYVGSYDGAIGYVNSKSIGSSERSQVKIISTIPLP